MKKTIGLIITLLTVLFAFASCSGEMLTDSDPSGIGGGGYVSGLNKVEAPELGDTADGSAEPEEGTSPEQIVLPAGQMTAGAWNDNDNYELWADLFAQGEETNGKFFAYSSSDNSWEFNSRNRVKVTVKRGESAVSGIKVSATDEDGAILFSAVTDANGAAYIFTSEESGSITATVGTENLIGEFSAEKRELTLSASENTEKKNIIEIMFVIDVTGSMGDELQYVEAEISDVISRVSAKNNGAVINMALLFYRDSGDNEKFAYLDFTNVTEQAGLSKVLNAIKDQSATGGGDYPEAVDEALDIAVNKQWSDGAVTKLIFHILDAPPHEAKTNKDTYKAAVEKAAEKGIRICPILCSGSDYLTEYLTRIAAIYTGGTFIFVTDDSGIGGSHHDPELPNVTVELLNSLLVRVINGYHSGVFAEPIDWRQEVKQ